MWLKQSTAVTIKLGPFVDDGDGKTPENGLTISQADVRLSKNGGDFAQKGESSSCTNDENGWYDCSLNTADTGTLGRLLVAVYESGALLVWREFMVVPSNVWDSMFGLEYLNVNVAEISDDSTAADDLELLVENSLGSDNKILISQNAQDLKSSLVVDAGAISGSTSAADNVEANIGNLDAAITTRSSHSAADAADAVWDELRSGHTDSGSFGEGVLLADGAVTAAAIATGAIDADAIAANAITDSEIADGALTAAKLAASATAQIADGVWDEATSGHGTQGTFGEAYRPVRANTAQGGAAGSITLDTGASGTDNYYDGQIIYLTGGTGAQQSRRIDTYTGSSKVATVTPDWAVTPSSDTDFVILPEGDVPGASAPSAAQVADAVWDEATSGHNTQGTFGEVLTPIRANTAQTGAAGSITLDTGASGTDNYYDGQIIYLTGGTGALQSRRIDTYTGSSKVATVSPDWATTPSSDTTFVILPEGDVPGASAPTVAQIADGVWDEARSGHTTGGTFGEGVLLPTGAITAAVIDTGAIDADAIASNAIASAKIADGAITANKLADNAITAAKLATACITSAELGGTATAEIADAVWALSIVGYTTEGTAGEQLNDAAAASSPATIADAVWDEARSGHTTGGTFGEGVLVESLNTQAKADVNAEADTALSDYDPPTDTEMDAAFAALNDPSAADIADAVWDELMSGHLTQGSFGERLYPMRVATAQGGAAGSITLDSGASSVDDFYDGQIVVLTGGTGAGQSRRIDTYTGSSKVATISPDWATTPTSSTKFMLLPEGDVPGASAPTAAQVADAVWDELLSGHTTTGSAGEATGWIDDVKNKTDNLPSSPAAVGSAMTLADSAITDVKMTAAARNAIADHIWRRTYNNIRTSSNGDAVTFRSGLGMLSHFNNYPYVSSGVLYCTHEDDSTVFGTRQLTSDADAEPIIGINTV